MTDHPGAERYPVPTAPPRYTSGLHKIPGDKRLSLADLAEYACVALAVGLTIWLAWLVAEQGVQLSPAAIGWGIVFWALMAYLALPRLHQLLASLYVPDYFIARTRTGDGLLGDPVNLAMDGTEADIHAAMRAAGWTRADEITLGSAWGIIVSSVLRRSYPAAPVSDLFLFGRRHAFAYQQEVDGNAAQRHHIRFWPVPDGWVLPGGQKVGWLAAGTYDRAVGLSLFTGQVTHKIDADIDVERDYVINTVRYADPACTVRVIEDFSTAYHHRNGGGDAVRTDGDLPVLDVTGAAARDGGHAASGTGSAGSGGGRDERGERAGRRVASDGGHRPVRSHHLPPAPFLLVGLLLGLSVAAVALVWVLVAVAVHCGAGTPADLGGVTMAELGGVSLTAVLLLGLWVATAARRRWARIILMVLSVLGAVQDLATVAVQGHHASGLLTAALSVLILWAVSADSMRQWVQPAASGPGVDQDVAASQRRRMSELRGGAGERTEEQDEEHGELHASDLDARARRLVGLVAGLNLAGMLIEMGVAAWIGSASLLADAADFLEDFLINALVLAALGWSVAGRRRASYALAGLILIPALAALVTAAVKLVTGAPPDGGVLSTTALLALVLNAACALCLLSLRSTGQALVRGAWLAARNDVLANLLMIGAGVLTLVRPSVWPDVVVGAVMAVVNLRAAREVLEVARAEDPELELDGD